MAVRLHRGHLGGRPGTNSNESSCNLSVHVHVLSMVF